MIGCTTNIKKGIVRYDRLGAGLGWTGGRVTFPVAQKTFGRRASYSQNFQVEDDGFLPICSNPLPPRQNFVVVNYRHNPLLTCKVSW